MIQNLVDTLKTNAAIVIMEAFFVALFSFGTFAILTHSTSLENIGVWVLLNSLLNFARIADFWSNGLSSFVGQAIGLGELRRANMFVGTTLCSGAIGYLAIVAIAFPILYLLAGPLVSERNVAQVRSLLPLMFTTFWLTAMAGIYQGAFLGFGRPAYKALQNVGGAALFMVGAYFLAPHFGLRGILIAQGMQGLAMLVFGIAFFHLYVPGAHKRIIWDATIFGAMSRFGGKGSALGVFQLAIEPIIRLLANHFGGLSVVTIVDLAARLIAAVRSLIGAVGTIMIPQFAELGARDPASAREALSRYEGLFAAMALSVFPGMLSALPLLGAFMLPNRSTDFVMDTWILTAGWVTNVLAAPTYYWLFAARRLRVIFQSMMIMALGAIGFGYLGGTAFGSLGALIGCALALGLSSGFLMVRGAPELRLFGNTAMTDGIQFRSMIPLAIAFAAQPITSVLTSSFLSAPRGIVHLTILSVPFIACSLAAFWLGTARSIPQLIIRLQPRQA